MFDPVAGQRGSSCKEYDTTENELTPGHKRTCTLRSAIAIRLGTRYSLIETHRFCTCASKARRRVQMVGPSSNNRRRTGTRTVSLGGVTVFDRRCNCSLRGRRTFYTMRDTVCNGRSRRTRSFCNDRGARARRDLPRSNSIRRRNSCTLTCRR